MRIDFNKTIKSSDGLEHLLIEKPPKYINHNPNFQTGYFIEFYNDLSELNKYLVNNLEQEFNKISSAKRTADNTLWILGDNSFSLDLHSRKLEIHASKKYRWEKISSKEKKGVFRTKQMPVFREIPVIEINGNVYFEKLGDIDPNPVLDILINNRYATKVIPTSEELEKAIKKARTSPKSSYSSSYPSNLSDDGGLGLGLGLF